MNSVRMLTPVFILYCLFFLVSCASEPTSTEECLDKYLDGIDNSQAVIQIKKSCAGLFDNNKTDDAYHQCILDDIGSAKTDKDVNHVLRQCTMDFLN